MKRKQQKPAFEVTRHTVWFHGGWGITLDPSFEHVRDQIPNTLSFEDKMDRGVCLSPYQIRRTDGGIWSAEDMLAQFPPPDFKGHRYNHQTAQVSSKALWMFGDSDNLPSSWLLVALVMSKTTPGKGAQCTLTTPRESDLGWALETWRSIIYMPSQDEAARKAPLGG